MANAFSQSLMSMAVFSAVSFLLGCPVVSYALFATGMTTVVLSDIVRRKSSNRGHLLVSGVTAVVLQGVGFLGGFDLSVLLILPISVTVVQLLDSLSSRNRSVEDELQAPSKTSDDPLANLTISLPSAVLLLVFLAIA